MGNPVALTDFGAIKIVSDPHIAPNGEKVLFTVRTTDFEKNKYRTSVWMGWTDGSLSAYQLTSPDHNSSSARWSPAGDQIAFLSDRNKPISQIYLMSTSGGEARPVTTLTNEGSISGLSWSPDGRYIAFLYRKTSLVNTEKAVAERRENGKSSPVKKHTSLGYRHDGSGYDDGEYTQIRIVNIETGETRELTQGDFNCDVPCWLPGSDALAFISDRRPKADILPIHHKIYTISIEGGDLSEIYAPAGSKSNLAVSPNGEFFAFTGNQDEKDVWGVKNSNLYLIPAAGTENPVDLTGALDESVGYLTLSDCSDAGVGDAISFSSDSRTIYFPISSNGTTRLCKINLNSPKHIHTLTPLGCCAGYHVSKKTEEVAYIWGDASRPHELFLLFQESGISSNITYLNSDWLDDTDIEVPEVVEIAHADGVVHGWLIRPPDFDISRKYPLILYIHGGPHLQYGDSFFHELQWLGASGYMVLYVNPRGSKGYGEAHTGAIKGAWGTVDYQDLMTAVDFACTLPEVDSTRLAVMGGSYGGYMTAWIVGHTNRFKCAIADRLVANLVSMSGTCDFPWHHEYYYTGNAWSSIETLWCHSPLAYAGNIETPLLLIHSDGDLRCPVGQAEEMFAAMRMQDKVVEFIRYPAETSHGMSRNGPPDLRVDRLQRTLEWLQSRL